MTNQSLTLHLTKLVSTRTRTVNKINACLKIYVAYFICENIRIFKSMQNCKTPEDIAYFGSGALLSLNINCGFIKNVKRVVDVE